MILGVLRCASPTGSTYKQQDKASVRVRSIIDPYTNELVVFGYEAKGLGTLDIVIYALDEHGNNHDVQWIKAPRNAFIHDCVITRNFILLVVYPFDGDGEGMKQGKQHWTYRRDRPATFILALRRPSQPVAPGWQPGEYRVYEWDHAILLHTAGAWEAENNKLYFESSRIMYNMLPCFEPEGSQWAPGDFKADFVRWEVDVTAATGARLRDPHVVLDRPSEFPRFDERFMPNGYDWVVLVVILPNSKGCLVPVHLNGLALVNTRSEETTYFDPEEDCAVKEPVFIPRSKEAPEGDDWVMAMVERMKE